MGRAVASGVLANLSGFEWEIVSVGRVLCLGLRGSGRDAWRLIGNCDELVAGFELKSLILAQIERWRHALHMQVERQHGGNPGGEWRTGE